MIYLDYAATTPVDPRVAAKMMGYLTMAGDFGNPSSHHLMGQTAMQAIENAAEQVATLIHAQPQEIIWTSGATESNNLALKGILHSAHPKGRHLVTSKTEHKSILDVCRVLEQQGCTVTYLDPAADGRVDPACVEAALRPDTVLVSIQQVNNETGVIQDLAAIGAVTRKNNVLLHVDAAQSVGKIAADVSKIPIDLMSLSAHKAYGPKGIGALYVRRRVRLAAQLQGGGQQRGLRPGTLPTHQIVGMGEAFRLAAAETDADMSRIHVLRDRLWSGLQRLEAVYLNGHPTQRVATHLNVSFAGIDQQALLLALPGLAISTGSACTSGSSAPSHVLRAMRLDRERLRGAIRLSMGRWTTAAEIEQALSAISQAVNHLRDYSPRWPLASAFSTFLSTRPSAQKWCVGEASEPIEGAQIAIHLAIDAHDCIQQAVCKVYGCGLADAFKPFSQALVGKSRTQATAIDHRQIQAWLALPPQQVHCAVLAETALQNALNNALSIDTPLISNSIN